MKNIYKYNAIFLALIMAFLNINISNAQTFVAASTPDSQAAANQNNVKNTGNYSVEYKGGNFHAMVWDGDTPGLAWYNTNGDQGSIPLDGSSFGQIEDPDIALYTGTNNNYDPVVFTFIIYLIDSNVYYESWIYNQGIWTINVNATQLTWSNKCSTPNTDIDESPNNLLAAVWQDEYNLVLFQSNPAVPQNHTITTLLYGNIADIYQTPDVAVMDNWINIVYIFNSHVGIDLRVNHYLWSNLTLQSQDDFYLLSPGLANQLGKPRIAVPNTPIQDINGVDLFDNYQAVINISSVDVNEILGFNKYQYSIKGPTLLNNKLTDYGNYEPVVTYTLNNNLVASWLYDHVYLPSGGSGIIVPTGGKEMLQTKLNINGGNPINPSDFFVVNYQYPRQCLAPSISGRFAKWDRVLYTAYDNQLPNEIFYKTSPYAGPNIRIGQFAKKPLIYPNPAKNTINIFIADNNKEPCSLNIYDVNGKMILSTLLYNTSTNVDISKLNKGIYFVRVTGNTISKVEKLIIN